METLQKIEKQLTQSGTPFVEGDAPSTADHTAFTEVVQKKAEPSADKTPNAYAWYLLIGQFDASVRSSWPAPTKGGANKGQEGKVAANKGQEGGGKKDKKDKKGDKGGGDAGGGANAKALAKQKRLQERQEKEKNKKGKKEEEYVKDPNDPCADKFGDLELNRSQSDPNARGKVKYLKIEELNEGMAGQSVNVRGRIHKSRATGNTCFIELREKYETVQANLFAQDTSKGMVKYAGKIPKESIVQIKAKVQKAEVKSCTISNLELVIQEIWTVNKSAPMLPFQIEDASRVVLDQTAEDGGGGQDDDKKEKGDDKQAVVKQDVRLNNRIIDLRVPTNQAIMHLQAAVSNLFREFLYDNNFVEIHSPKLIGGASEGGANVFTLSYFNQPACMAQSPQLYKQMALCADMDRVFEIGPVFRAENSNTNRHLTEFTGLDMEMVIKEHYFEVLDMLGDMFCYIFDGLEKRYAKDLEIINRQYPFEPFKCKKPVVKLHFKDGIKMLHDAGIEQAPLEDLSSETEKQLGKLVRDKYDTDFYMLYGYPANARPFYTMLDPTDSNYTNSYDFFMRGEEITSGAQRIHDHNMLTKRLEFFEVPVETLKDYVDSFKYGAPAHGGCGIGLERIVKFYCNLYNIRKASLFPRDPKRIKP